MEQVIAWYEDRSGKLGIGPLPLNEAADWLCWQCESLDDWRNRLDTLENDDVDPADTSADPILRLAALDELQRGCQEARWGYSECAQPSDGY